MVIRLLSPSVQLVVKGAFSTIELIPDWSWEEVSVASTYSSAILDPLH